MENKNKMEYAGETFIQSFHERVHKLKDLSEKLDKKEAISEELREKINGLIKDFKEGKKILAARAEEVDKEVKEKLMSLKEWMLVKPSYEKAGSLTDEDYGHNQETGSTHRAIVFKVGKEILVETGDFNSFVHDDLAKKMYRRNLNLLEQNGISASDLAGARLYIQKAKHFRVAPKDNVSNDNFLKHTAVFSEKELADAETEEKRAEMEKENEKTRERILKEIFSQTKQSS